MSENVRMNFIGRTIIGVERPVSEHGEYEDTRRWLLRLDDGTAVEFAAEGWEVDETTIVHLTPEVIRQRALDAEAERRDREEEAHRRAEADERRRQHIEQMRGELSPEAFEKWRRETYPTLNEMLKDTWTGPPVASLMAERSPLLDLLG